MRNHHIVKNFKQQDRILYHLMHSAQVSFDSNKYLPDLFGEYDRHLADIERQYHITVIRKGNELTLNGDNDDINAAQDMLQYIHHRLSTDPHFNCDDIRQIILNKNYVQHQEPASSAIIVQNKRVEARGDNQIRYLQAMRDYDLVFGVGPAGTGKTHLAVCHGVSLLMKGVVERLIFSRPAVEAGERLGFLPGDMNEKIDPYLRPIFDSLRTVLSQERIEKLRENGKIELAPVAYMRGRTLNNAFIVLDEAQNTTPMQMKMILTRLGHQSSMVVTGDLSQVDLPSGQLSGLQDALNRLSSIDMLHVHHFTSDDIVRHPLVSEIVKSYTA